MMPLCLGNRFTQFPHRQRLRDGGRDQCVFEPCPPSAARCNSSVNRRREISAADWAEVSSMSKYQAATLRQRIGDAWPTCLQREFDRRSRGISSNVVT